MLTRLSRPAAAFQTHFTGIVKALQMCWLATLYSVPDSFHRLIPQVQRNQQVIDNVLAGA